MADHPQTPAGQDVHVWLTYYEPSGSGRHKAMYGTLDLAKRSCEAEVAEWIADDPWAEDDEPSPVLHAVEWKLEPDPGLPKVFHPNVPEDKYVWVGRYCAEEPTWLFKVVREQVVTHCRPAGRSQPVTAEKSPDRDENASAISAVAEAHQFTVERTTTRTGAVTRRARCTCDPSVEFDWDKREEQHRTHLLAAAFAAGQAGAANLGSGQR